MFFVLETLLYPISGSQPRQRPSSNSNKLLRSQPIPGAGLGFPFGANQFLILRRLALANPNGHARSQVDCM